MTLICKEQCGSRTCVLFVGGLRSDARLFLLKASVCRRQQHGWSVRCSVTDNQTLGLAAVRFEIYKKGLTETQVKELPTLDFTFRL